MHLPDKICPKNRENVRTEEFSMKELGGGRIVIKKA